MVMTDATQGNLMPSLTSLALPSTFLHQAEEVELFTATIKQSVWKSASAPEHHSCVYVYPISRFTD